MTAQQLCLNYKELSCSLDTYEGGLLGICPVALIHMKEALGSCPVTLIHMKEALGSCPVTLIHMKEAC